VGLNTLCLSYCGIYSTGYMRAVLLCSLAFVLVTYYVLSVCTLSVSMAYCVVGAVAVGWRHAHCALERN
jgi:hypothetical protein